METGTVKLPRARVDLWYDDVDVSADVTPHLEAFEYADYGSGQVDDLQVAIKDPDDRWCHEWHPDQGARLRAEIVSFDGSQERRLPCGEFVIDTPTYGAPGQITLKATSAAVTTSLRRQKKTRQWQHVTLKQLADRIAADQAVTVYMVGQDTPPITKVIQKDESDLEFLLRMCQRQGYTLKVDSGRLVICRQSDIDSAAAVATIWRGGDVAVDWSFSQEWMEKYRACTVA